MRALILGGLLVIPLAAATPLANVFSGSFHAGSMNGEECVASAGLIVIDSDLRVTANGFPLGGCEAEGEASAEFLPADCAEQGDLLDCQRPIAEGGDGWARLRMWGTDGALLEVVEHPRYRMVVATQGAGVPVGAPRVFAHVPPFQPTFTHRDAIIGGPHVPVMPDGHDFHVQLEAGETLLVEVAWDARPSDVDVRVQPARPGCDLTPQPDLLCLAALPVAWTACEGASAPSDPTIPVERVSFVAKESGAHRVSIHASLHGGTRLDYTLRAHQERGGSWSGPTPVSSPGVLPHCSFG